MSRTTARAAAVTGLTATTAAAGLLLAPAAFAAAPSAPVVAPGTVAAEQTFTVSGADCVSENYANPNLRNVVAVAVGEPEAEEALFVDVTEPAENGTWSIDLSFEVGDPAGEYVVAAACLLYNGGLVSEYPLASVAGVPVSVSVSVGVDGVDAGALFSVTVTTSCGSKPVRTLTTLRPSGVLSPVAEPPSGLATPAVLACEPRIAPVGLVSGAAVVGASVPVGDRGGGWRAS